MDAMPPNGAEAAVSEPPLCVHLRDALLPASFPIELVIRRIRARPLSVFRVLRSQGAQESARDANPLDVEHLPYNRALVDQLRAERDRGRTLVLVADTERETADAIAAHLGIFDEVIVHGGGGRAPDAAARALTRRFGSDGFAFMGGSGRAPAGLAPSRVFAAPRVHAPPDLRLVLRAMRVHQWLKNALVFLPVLAGQRFGDPGTVLNAVLAFIAFSLTASSVYVVNDLLDLQADRRHPRKRDRPFASGRLPLTWAPFMLAAMLGTAGLLSVLALPPAFAVALGAYLVLTFAYSLKLKGAALIDVFLLAALYTLRVIAGAAATGIAPSVWLLGFCMFFFLSLALVKRYAELHALVAADPALSRLPGRSYRAGDLPVLVAMGVATGCLSVLVLALYVISDEFAAHYTHPILLWQLCPLTLYWIGRAWLVVARDEMHDDPLVWAVKDQLSRGVGIAAVLILILAR